MQAQVLSLQDNGASACLVGSAQRDVNILSKINEDNYSIVYCSPEFLQSEGGTKLLNILKGRLNLIAIDEAHVSLLT